MINPLGQHSGFNSSLGHPQVINQPFGQPSGFNPSMGQPQILSQPVGQQSNFNSPMGQLNNLNQPLGPTSNFNEPINQKVQPNIYNPAAAQINSFHQPRSVGQLPNLIQQPTFQPIQGHLNAFPQVIPPSPNFNQSSSIYNQRAPSGEILYIYLSIKYFSNIY